MKRSIKVFTVVLAVLLVLCSCSKKGETTETTKSTSTAKVSITLLNSKGEIQTGLEKIASQFEKDKGIHVEVIACGAGEVPYTMLASG